MARRPRKQKLSREEWLEELLQLKPARVMEWERDPEGKVILLVPKFRDPILGRLIQPRLRRRPHFHVNLDEVGTFVWEQCTGEKTVSEIVESMQSHFGERVEPAVQRLSLFLSQLASGRFIRYK